MNTPHTTVAHACLALSHKDQCLARALEIIGTPVIRARPAGYAGLFRIIVEQQVSIPSAQAILKRCDAAFSPYDPEIIARKTIEALRACGLSRPKAGYCLGLAHSLCAGEIDLSTLGTLSDEVALEYLCQIKGIGPWSAAIYLLFCEQRHDIWPVRDVALLGAYRALHTQILSPPTIPHERAHNQRDSDQQEVDQKKLDLLADSFAPHRGVAAHILWTYYAHLKGRAPI